MKCPKCQTENSDTQKFCGECGTRLAKTCPKCGSSNPPQYKFCGECGQDLTISSEPAPKDLSFDEKLDKIQRYLPEGLTRKILSQRNKIEGERKQVTVMFCDMEGFTPLVEKLGPEEAYTVMDQVYEILIHKVHDYEGTVNEMTGDGIMALFGAPIALEDAPQRAVRAAMAIHREMARFSDRIKEGRATVQTTKMRIGIHTGPVVVGTLGNNLRVEFKAVGDTVNLASRMEGLADPGTTYVTEDTFRLTEGFFRFEGLGDKRVKGKEAPIRVYRVLEASTRRTRFDVSAERGLTPLAGREPELDLLLDAYERSKAGRGQAMSIVSEAGVGKSRLLYEFRKSVSNEDVTFLEGKCLSYSRNVAYHPVTDVLRGNFDIQEADDDSRITEKVKNGLKALAADEASTLPYLLELLSVKESGMDKIAMSPEAKRYRIAGALNHIVLKGSEMRPLILAFEDLHWIDKSSEDTLKGLLDNIAGSRVFLILTYRPEYACVWGGKSYHSQVNLNRLSNRETLSMVTHLLGTKNIAGDLEEMLLQKTEGVPFFIEEFVKSLRDLKIITKTDGRYQLQKEAQSVEIPSTIQDVIMARVDSLPEGAKEVLQTGAVIEREFNYELIKHVMGLSESELIPHLSALKDAELLYERGVHPETTYIFKHALTRKVVYDSILTKKKKDLHEKIGNVIEELYKDDIQEYHGMLTEHFIKSENYEKGAEYSRMARKKCLQAGSVDEGIEYAKKAVMCLERLPQSDKVQKKIIKARTILGFHYSQLNYHAEAKEAIFPIVDLALKSEDRRRQSQVLTILGNYSFMVEQDFRKAITFLKKSLKIAEQIGDIASVIQTEFWLGLGLSLNCEFKEGLNYLQRSLEKSLAVKSLWGASVAESNISCWVYFWQGKFKHAFQHSLEAIKLAEKSDDIYSKTIAYSCHGLSCYGKGFLDEAESNFLKGIELADKISYFIWMGVDNLFLGEIHSEMGAYRKAAKYYERAIPYIEAGGTFNSWASWSRMALARTKLMTRGQDIDLGQICNYVSENKLRLLEGCLLRCVGEILLYFDDQNSFSEAEEWIKKAVEVDKRNGVMWHLGRDYSFYSELLNKKGNQEKARESLNKAITIFKKCEADGWVEKYEKELASLSREYLQ